MTSETSPRNSVSIAFTGAGGAGVITAGTMLLDAAAQAGLYGQFARSSGPQIRGGEAAAMLRLADGPVDAPGDAFDVLIAIDWFNIERFAVELPLTPDSLVFADPSQGEVPTVIADTGAQIIELPLKDMAKDIPGGRPNMIALGVAQQLLGLPDQVVDDALTKTLAKRGEEALVASRAGVDAGKAAAQSHTLNSACPSAKPDAPKRWRISGNEAVGMGAIKGGVRFVAAYPITPATEILEWMASKLPKVGGGLVQAEDELASINMIIGASYGGAASLTATSGPGLSLMSESLGLAIASEIPLVVVDVMRGGPSTGIPTKTEQSDLNIAVFGQHGDAPHLVLAPHSVGDCLPTTEWAVTLAEAIQTPAIVLSDQMLGQTKSIIDQPQNMAFSGKRLTPSVVSDHYKRYAVGGDGISIMTIPGIEGGQYTADGLEHMESGVPSAQTADHSAQLDKRANKLNDYDFGEFWGEIEGEADLAIVTWGSSTSVVREALARLKADGIDIRLVAPRLLAPLQKDVWAKSLEGVKRALVVELNHQGQFFHYIKGHLDLDCTLEQMHRPGPLPFRVNELAETIRTWRDA